MTAYNMKMTKTFGKVIGSHENNKSEFELVNYPNVDCESTFGSVHVWIELPFRFPLSKNLLSDQHNYKLNFVAVTNN
jgi:hypothetical protein